MSDSSFLLFGVRRQFPGRRAGGSPRRPYAGTLPRAAGARVQWAARMARRLAGGGAVLLAILALCGCASERGAEAAVPPVEERPVPDARSEDAGPQEPGAPDARAVPQAEGEAPPVVQEDAAPEPEEDGLPPAPVDVRLLAGQMVMVGFEGTELTAGVIRFLQEYRVGNVVLFRRNLLSAVQMRRLCSDIQDVVRDATGHPAFICLDLEGGERVLRYPDDMVQLAGAAEFAEHGDPALLYEAAVLTARQLRLCGVNVDLAPVVDVNSNPSNPVIGVRSYGSTAEAVVAYSTQMIRGLQDGGVLCAAKHFPGHGDTDTDSHRGLPVISKGLEELRAVELVPFAAAVRNGVPLVMSAHIIFPSLDAERPATMSRRILTGLLREELGFGGMIVTDAVDMAAIQDHYGRVAGALAAVDAGADIVCVSVLDGQTVDLCEALASGVAAGRLLESYGRIVAAKDALPQAEEHSAAEFRRSMGALNARLREINAVVRGTAASAR